jgi:hypothetical protein
MNSTSGFEIKYRCYAHIIKEPSQIGNGTGNPWVVLGLPVPVPVVDYLEV